MGFSMTKACSGSPLRGITIGVKSSPCSLLCTLNTAVSLTLEPVTSEESTCAPITVPVDFDQGGWIRDEEQVYCMRFRKWAGLGMDVFECGVDSLQRTADKVRSHDWLLVKSGKGGLVPELSGCSRWVSWQRLQRAT